MRTAYLKYMTIPMKLARFQRHLIEIDENLSMSKSNLAEQKYDAENTVNTKK